MFHVVQPSRTVSNPVVHIGTSLFRLESGCLPVHVYVWERSRSFPTLVPGVTAYSIPPGRPKPVASHALCYDFGFMAQYAIGVDLGGTNLRAAAIDTAGRVLEKLSGRTELRLGRDAVLDDMVESINTLRQKCGTNTLVGVGVGVPGFIEIEKGFIVGSNNLPQFENFPVRDAIEQRLGTKVILENDANAAALGEKWIGAGRDVDDLVLLTLGTGIGGGIISHGRILHGFVGMAGELGHMTVYPNGNPCGCGNQGCLEKHASATAILGMARMLGLGSDLTSEGVYTLHARASGQ
jgi:glucokinase